jgi:hypothetical protein
VARACPVDLLLDAPRRAANPSGPRPAIALECLRRRALALAVDNPRWLQPPRYTVSDFWFDETRALTLSRIAECEPSHVFRLWRRLKPRVVRPRLIVWLDVPAPRGLRRDFQRQLRRRDVGPVLRIDDPQSPEAINEVVGAIQAMG